MCKLEFNTDAEKESQSIEQNKWLVNYDNGVKFGIIDLKCPKCGHCVICPKVDVPNFCGKCGSRNKKEGERSEQTIFS